MKKNHLDTINIKKNKKNEANMGPKPTQKKSPTRSKSPKQKQNQNNNDQVDNSAAKLPLNEVRFSFQMRIFLILFDQFLRKRNMYTKKGRLANVHWLNCAIWRIRRPLLGAIGEGCEERLATPLHMDQQKRYTRSSKFIISFFYE